MFDSNDILNELLKSNKVVKSFKLSQKKIKKMQ
jgi:hypothetical protein